MSLEVRINLGRTFEELRRRKVFRTAATYLAVIFVLLQVAELTFEPLGISADAYRVLVILCGAGFPIAAIVSWFFDLRATKASTDEADVAPADAVQHRWTSVAAALFVLLCAGAVAWFSAFRYGRADYGDSVTMAVLPFDVIGGSDIVYLRTGIVEMLSRNVDGAGRVRAIAPDMVIAAVKKQKSADDVAREFAARYVVSGNVLRAGSNVRVTATVQDYGHAGARPTMLTVTVPVDQLFDGIDRLSAQILAATRSGEDAHLSQSAALTTNSLPALRHYLEGEDFYRRAQYDSAIVHFTNAVSVDSTFALAYYRLAVAHFGRGSLRAAREPVTHALQYSNRLSQRDQRLVKAFAAAFDGHWRAAESELRALQARYPEDMEVTYSLGSLLTVVNPRRGQNMEEPTVLLEKVTQVDSKFLCPI